MGLLQRLSTLPAGKSGGCPNDAYGRGDLDRRDSDRCLAAFYAVLGYYRPAGVPMSAKTADSPVAPKRHPWIPIICVGLVWLAVGADYFTRPLIAEATILSYGLVPSNVPDTDGFNGIVQLRDWTGYKNERALLHCSYAVRRCGSNDRYVFWLQKVRPTQLTGADTMDFLRSATKLCGLAPNQDKHGRDTDFAVCPHPELSHRTR